MVGSTHNVCPSCGALNEVMANQQEEIDDLRRQLRAAKGMITRLRKQQDSMTPEEMEATDRVYKHWKKELAPHAKVFNDERRNAVLGLLRQDYAIADLYRLIEGVKRSPWHMSKKKVDLAYICRNASIADEFIALAPQPRPEVAVTDMRFAEQQAMAERRGRRAPIVEMVRERLLRYWEADYSLTDVGLGDVECWPCPLCMGRFHDDIGSAYPLLIDRSGNGPIALCNRCGMSVEDPGA